MNTIEKLFEEFKRQYKELEEENNRLKLEIIKLAVMQNMSNILKEKTDNKQNNEISDSKLEEKEDSSINSFFDPNKKDESSLSSLITENVNSISFKDKENSISLIEPFIKQLKNYSFSNFHFICKKCWRIPTLKFIKKNKLLYTCKCEESPREIFIKNIYDFLVDINKNKVDINEVLKCKKDENEKYIFYCEECKKNRCNKCSNDYVYNHINSIKFFAVDRNTIDKINYIIKKIELKNQNYIDLEKSINIDSEDDNDISAYKLISKSEIQNNEEIFDENIYNLKY